MTINAFKNTIFYDEEVFRWAISFLNMPSVRREISRKNAFFLRMLHFAVLLFGFAVSICLVKAIMTMPKVIDLWFIAGGIIGTLLLEIPYKKLTAVVTTGVVLSNYSAEDLKDKTMLQLGVMLEKKYGSLPMSDAFADGAIFVRKLFVPFIILILSLSFFNPRMVVYSIIILCLWVLRIFSRTSAVAKFLLPDRKP